MERKSAAGTVAVTRDEVRGALGRAKTLSSAEEKVVRMRYGAGAESLSKPLPRAAAGNAELEDELLVIEMQLMRAFKMRQQQQAQAAAKSTARPQASKAKDKIVRALRKKK